MNGDRMILKGWHAPGIFGSFPAALSAGIVLGLDAGQLAHALGIAGTQASGLMAAQFGSMVKRMQCAKNSQSGLYAALLAAEGFTGIEDVFEQEFGGFCTTFTQTKTEFDVSRLTEGLGTSWETMRIDLKRHAALATNFSAIDAVEELMDEKDLVAADVEEILVKLTQSAVSHGSWTYVPAGLTAAQMNLGFGIAMQLVERQVFVDQMVDRNIARPDLVALANRVKAVRDPGREQKPPQYHRGATVEVRLKNGETLHSTVDYFVGSHHRPMSEAQVVAKFRNLASRTLPSDSIARIEEIIWNLERETETTTLSRILRGERRPASAQQGVAA
jgi:2-methylcitrate dehydratase PrpD